MAAMQTKLAGRGGLLKAFWKMRRFLLCGFIFSTFDMATQDPLSAFLYSLVECPPPQPVPDVGCPEGSVLESSGICQAEPRSSPSWSLSAHCADREHVVKTATEMRGAILVGNQVVGIVALLLVGPAVDAFGRRPILMLALLSQVICTALLFQASLLGMAHKGAVTLLLAVAYAFSGAAVALFGPAAAAMVADLSRGSASLRGDGFAALTMMDNMSLVVGFSAMYPIMKMHLVDYAPMWGSFTAIGALALLLNGMVLQETMPSPICEMTSELTTDVEEASSAEDAPPQSILTHVLLNLTVGFRVVAADPFLWVLVLVSAFATMSMNASIQLLSAYQVAVLDYDNAKASLCFMVLPFIGAISSSLASPLIRRCGVRALLLVVLAVDAAGLAIMGGGAAAGGGRGMEATFWLGLTLAAIGWNLATPCLKTMVSTRVETEHQGNVFALVQLVAALLQATLGLLWPEYLFDADAAGVRRGAAFLATAAVLCLCGLGLLAASRTSRSAEHAESSDGESSDEGEATDGESSSGSEDLQRQPQLDAQTV